MKKMNSPQIVIKTTLTIMRLSQSGFLHEGALNNQRFNRITNGREDFRVIFFSVVRQIETVHAVTVGDTVSRDMSRIDKHVE